LIKFCQKFHLKSSITHDFNQILKFSQSYFIIDEELNALNVSKEASEIISNDKSVLEELCLLSSLFLLPFSLDLAMVDRSKKKFGQAGKVYVAGVKIIQDDEGMWDEFVELMKGGGNVVNLNKMIRDIR